MDLRADDAAVLSSHVLDVTISRIPEMPGHAINERFAACRNAATTHEATYKDDCTEANLDFHAIAFDSYGVLLGKSHSFLAKTK